MNEEKQQKVNKAIEKMLYPNDTYGGKLTRRLRADGIYGWIIEYHEHRDYFTNSGMRLCGTITAVDHLSQKDIGIEEFGIVFNSQYLTSSIEGPLSAYELEMNTAYNKMKERIIKVEKIRSSVQRMWDNGNESD